MKRWLLLPFLLAGCGDDAGGGSGGKKAAFVPDAVLFEAAAVKNLGLENVEHISFADTEDGEYIYRLEGKKHDERSSRRDLIGRIQIKVCWDEEEAEQWIDNNRARLERDRPGGAKGLHRVRDRIGPGSQTYVLTEDLTHTEYSTKKLPVEGTLDERRRIVQIGFLIGNLVVRITLHGLRAKPIQELERDAGKVAVWADEVIRSRF